MKKSLTILACCIPFLSAFAQTGIRDAYSYTLANTPWLTSRNAAGIWALPSEKMSKVQTGFLKANGGFADVHESDNSYEAAASAESFLKVSDHLAFSGSLAYSSFRGKNMGGPMLMDPYYNPVNLLESVDTTTGIKVKELYDLRGGISWKFSPRLDAGARIEYQTGNYAKRKDPRPQNDWMNLDASLGARYSFGRIRLGADATYQKTVETLEGDIFGTKDQRYYFLVDYGGYFGKVQELAGDSGYVSTDNPRPMFNQFFGGDVQFESNLGRLGLHFELGGRYRTGYYGKKSSSSVQFYTFDGFSGNFSGQMRLECPRVLHVLNLSAVSDRTAGDENSFSYSTNPGSGTVIQYFGKQRAGNNWVSRAGAAYRADIEPTYGKLPMWMAGGGVEVVAVDRTGVVYPFYRSQQLIREHFYVNGQRYWERGRNAFCALLALSFQTGAEPKLAEGSYAQATGDPRSNAVYAGRNREYFTVPAYGGSLSFRWTRFFSETIQGYLDIGDRCLVADRHLTFLTGQVRNVFTILIGCTF